MDIALLSYGSRGDVQPYLALAHALGAIGHRARLIAPPNFADIAAGHPVEFCPVGVDIQAQLSSERIRELTKSGNLVRNFQVFRDELRGFMDDTARDTLRACQGSDLLIGVSANSYSLAEKLGVPFIEAVLQPITPTRAFPSPIAFPKGQLGGALNRLSHVAFEQIFWQLFRTTVDRMRTHTLGLPPYGLRSPLGGYRDHALLRMHAYSAHVVPRPSDWPAQHQVTGYWFLPPPAGWRPPAELSAFLAAGPPPVYVGFGSMMARDAQKMTALVTEALARSGQRGLLAGGWGALAATEQRSDQLFFVNSIPHHWLFPRMAAVVHHGGAGTTGASLRSGVPSVVVPFSFDQPFWGQRVAALGVGPAPIPRARLTAERLADAIGRAVSDQQLRERAARLGALIRAERGTAQAIDQIHRALGTTSIA